MLEELDARYLNWLHAQVVLEVAPTLTQSYYDLLGILHATEFAWLVPGDDNRAEYGMGLRVIFAQEVGIDCPDEWHQNPCSVLEMLIALAMEAEFETDTPLHVWFWRFMTVLGLSEMNDAGPLDQIYVSQVLDRLIWRTYEYDGTGGLFPLKHPEVDQRQVEIWYQFCAYVIEGALI